MQDDVTPATSETIFSEKFWRNRKGEVICVEIATLNGDRHVIDVRQWFTNRGGQLRPTKSGICINILRLSDLKHAVDNAHAAAEKLGLIKTVAK